MREIPMPPDRRPIAEKTALDAARNDDGLRVLLVKAIWRDDDLPTAAAQTGGFVYEIADRVARAVEARESELRATAFREYADEIDADASVTLDSGTFAYSLRYRADRIEEEARRG